MDHDIEATDYEMAKIPCCPFEHIAVNDIVHIAYQNMIIGTVICGNLDNIINDGDTWELLGKNLYHGDTLIHCQDCEDGLHSD